MLIKDFPNIDWLRKQANSNFADRTDSAGNIHPKEGWPNILLHTQSKGAERSDIKGPYSLFMNLKGKSIIRSEGKEMNIEENEYAITNMGQYYDLIIPEHTHTITFNLHFSETLFLDVSHTLIHSTYFLLENPSYIHGKVLLLAPHTNWKDLSLKQKILDLRYFYSTINDQDSHSISEEELLANFLGDHLEKEAQLFSNLEELSAQKKSTREELLRRIIIARDYVHGVFPKLPSLEELSTVSMLSKYHMLRTFQTIFNCTPSQYVSKLRLEKSKELLESRLYTITDIAYYIGFSDVPSFNRFFKKHTLSTPMEYLSRN